jgi:hypothetical protein
MPGDTKNQEQTNDSENAEGPGNLARDSSLQLKELREIVLLQMEALAEYDDPNAKALRAKLMDLVKWWSSRPGSASFGCC